MESRLDQIMESYRQRGYYPSAVCHVCDGEKTLYHKCFGDVTPDTWFDMASVSKIVCTTMLLFAILGIAGGTLNVAAWIALLWKRERNIAGNLILLVILFLSFNTQNLVANVFFWLFPMMALVERGLPLIEKE